MIVNPMAEATVVMIPARLRSTRLPSKPLAEIAGVPMIVHVWRRACAAAVGPVIVACAEPEIAEVVTAHGGTAALTDPDLPSGTDRIFQALGRIDREDQGLLAAARGGERERGGGRGLADAARADTDQDALLGQRGAQAGGRHGRPRLYCAGR